MEIKEILARVDHTLLSPTATFDDIKVICDDAVKYGTACVCIPPCYVKDAVDYVCGKAPPLKNIRLRCISAVKRMRTRAAECGTTGMRVE